MKCTKLDATTEKWIAEAKERERKQKEIQLERYRKIVDLTNQMTEIGNLFVDFLVENQFRLIGKKLVNNDGISKYFTAIFNEFKVKMEGSSVHSVYIQSGKLKIRGCVNGGYYDEHITYCDYLDHIVYDAIIYDGNGVCTAVREEYSSTIVYSFDEMIQSMADVNFIRKQIEDLEKDISHLNKKVPYHLHSKTYSL